MTDHTQKLLDGETEETARSRYVRTLLIVVITLGVILLVGMAIVVGTIIKRVSNPETNVPVKPGFGETQIQLPVGSKIDDVIATDGFIVVRVRDALGNLLILLDPRRGEERGRVRLNRRQ